MRSDLEQMHRAILLDPSDDVARLAYADELEATGEAGLAGFIRSSLMKPDFEVKVGIPEWRSGAWSEAEYCLRNRGFVDHWKCPLPDYIRCAKAVFSAHPVTCVVLVGKLPLYHPDHKWKWTASKKADADDHGLPWYFFPPHEREVRLPDWASAHNWLSRAAVNYGRSLAGLPPLPV